MSTGDHSLVSARARRREAALDPQDLAAREAGYPDYRTFKEQNRRSRVATLARATIAVALLGALVVATAALWRSGRIADVAGWAETQVSGTTDTAVADATPPPTTVERPAVVATIATTDGRGVAVRDACREEARSGGAFDEGASVTVLERGLGDCSGWSLVETGGTTSWVRNIFLDVAPLTGDDNEPAD